MSTALMNDTALTGDTAMAIEATTVVDGAAPSAQPRLRLEAQPRLRLEAQPRLRLTRRGRVVFTGLAAVPVVVGVMLAALNGGGATATSSNGEPELVTLQAGQSLWQLAEEIAPSADPRDVISDILAANELESGSVQAGQRIALPAEYSAE
jgi:hypothetical protein